MGMAHLRNHHCEAWVRVNAPTYWLIDCLFDWLVAWLIDWLVDWFVGCMIDWLFGWMMACMLDCLMGWLLDWLRDWLPPLIDALIDCFVVWLIDRCLFDIYIAWLVDWFIDRLVDWLPKAMQSRTNTPCDGTLTHPSFRSHIMCLVCMYDCIRRGNPARW